MKAQILKISGHKNEKDFYKEFPTMEKFMAKHGAALRKAQVGLGIPPILQYPQQQAPTTPYPGSEAIKGFANPFNTVLGGQQQQQQQASAPAQWTGSMEKPATIPSVQYAQEKGMIGKGDTNLNIATGIQEGAADAATKSQKIGEAVKTGIGVADKVIGGFKALKAEKAALKSARTWRDVSKLSRQASETEDVNARGDIADTQRRTRKALMPEVTGESLFPVNGVGTNVLAKFGKGLPTGGLKRSEDYGSKSKPYASVDKGDFAGGGRSYPIPTIQDAGDALRLAGLHNRPDVKAKVYAKYPELRKHQDGGEIQNMYNEPDDIYSDGGYEPLGESEPGFQPLSDTEIIKAYRDGGLIHKAQLGALMGGGGAGGAGKTFLGMGGSDWGGVAQAAGSVGSNMMGNNAGTQIGGGLGQGIGSMFGPAGGMIGGAVGSIAGGLLDQNAKKTARAQKEMMKNVNVMSGMGNLKNFKTGYSGVFQDGGGINSDVRAKYEQQTSQNPGERFMQNYTDASSIRDTHPDGSPDTITDMYTTQRDRGDNMRYKQFMRTQTGEEEPEYHMTKSYKPLFSNQYKTIDRPIGARRGERRMQDMHEFLGDREHGGYTNPRMIKYFGGHDVDDLFVQDPMMDTLRSGGSLRSNEVGDIQIDETRGNLRPMSYNPYTPGTGVTSMIEGPSHDNGGVNINYNGNMVEAEGGEPISERQDGGSVGGDTSAVITGDQTFNKMGAHEMPELAEYLGKKAKHIQKDLAEKDAKLNKAQKKNDGLLAGFTPITPIDKLKFNSLHMNEKGINEQYKRNAFKTESLIAYQEAINEEAEKRGLDAGELSRGRIKPLPPEEMRGAKFGMMLHADQGANVKPKVPIDRVKTASALPTVPKGQHKDKVFWGNVTQKDFETLKEQNPWYDWDTFDPSVQGDVRHFQTSFNKLAQKVGAKERLEVDDRLGQQTASAKVDLSGLDKTEETPKTPPPGTTDKEDVFETTKGNKNQWATLAGQLLPWLRKTPGEGLLGDQLAGEMYAMSHNQEEPVQARFYHPELDVPYDISFQDQLNQNQAGFNQIARQAGSNPEALSALAGQKYSADSNVLAEQFRANQAKKDQVYSQNRATLNDAQLKNLSIADQQYVRQAQAKSNTKAVMQESLNSIASKIGQNRLENRTLQTYSNMFPDFSYGKDYNIRKTGAPTTFNMPVVYNAAGDITHIAMYDENGHIYDYRPITDEDRKTMGKKKTETTTTEEKKKERNGGLVRSFKNI